jgi:hypothetical protein
MGMNMAAKLEPTEDQLQIYAADLLRAFAHKWLVWFHCPNGGHRNITVAKQLKSFGVRPGIADLCLTGKGGRTAYVELKTLNGRQTQDQKTFERDVKALGCPYVICRSPEGIKSTLLDMGFLDETKLGRDRGGVSGEGHRGTALPAAPDAMTIIGEVAAKYGITSELLRSKVHPIGLREARFATYRRLRDERMLSLNQIGRLMGGRDHTTIIHGLRDDRRQRDIAHVRGYKASPQFTRGARVDA